jgi:uncharacterized membrane protein
LLATSRAAITALSACQSAEAPQSTQAYDGIAVGETVTFTGTEPFWGGEVSRGTLVYKTPEDIEGRRIAVERFAGNNGVSFSGELDDAPFVMMVTPGTCSDGMSDRTYPFTVTLMVKGEQRSGCAHTTSQPFTGPQQP